MLERINKIVTKQSFKDTPTQAQPTPNKEMAYIHDNPVRAGFVDHAEHWLYSSQRNYSGLSTLIDIDMIEL